MELYIGLQLQTQIFTNQGAVKLTVGPPVTDHRDYEHPPTAAGIRI